jgi:hypothetical protein
MVMCLDCTGIKAALKTFSPHIHNEPGNNTMKPAVPNESNPVLPTVESLRRRPLRDDTFESMLENTTGGKP